MLMRQALSLEGEALPPLPPERLHPLVLAYVGDAYFTLYVRTRLLAHEQNRVRVLHTFDSKIVSATMQAFAIKNIEQELSEEEAGIVRRGRNAKSTPAKSASVGDYRYSTGFEALVGYLFLAEKQERLEEITSKVFAIIMQKIENESKEKE